MRLIDRDLIRGGHYGQRSCEPHLKAEHMAAPTNAAKREESSCQLGAVHTWHKADKPTAPAFVRYWTNSGHRLASCGMFIPRFTERGDRVLACRGIAPDTKAAVAAILTGDGPAPISVTR